MIAIINCQPIGYGLLNCYRLCKLSNIKQVDSYQVKQLTAFFFYEKLVLRNGSENLSIGRP